MGELTLLSDYCLDTTVLSNVYIDEYMASNNEAQVKIYLYLLRNLGSGKSVSVSSIADFFNYTVQDVERSLLFMQKQGLMKLEESEGGITGIRILPLAKKEVIVFKNMQESKPEVTKEQLEEFKQQPEIFELMFVAEQYIGKPLTVDDLQKLYYICNTLNFDETLTEYLIEYCVGLKKKNFGFFAKVAKEWHEAGVKSTKDAKQFTCSYPKEIYSIFNAFGIKSGNRKPLPGEISFAKQWLDKYGFSIEVIERACTRTVEKTHSVSFEYADAILRDWNEKGVKTLSDIEKLDEEFSKSKASKENSKTMQEYKTANQKNKFNGFSQRSYDYDELEKQLLAKKG